MTYPSDEFLNTIYLFLLDIGAKNDIGTTKAEKSSYVKRFYEKICAQNPLFPKNNESKVWATWMSDVISGKAPRRGNNLSAMLICFNDWIKLNAHDYLPKVTPQYATEDTYGSIESWPDSVLVNQLAIIKQIGDGSVDWLNGMRGARGYLGRLKAESQKRGISA